MTLTGQEARIMIRYLIPAHPQVELYSDLCTRYKQLSSEQLQKHKNEVENLAKVKQREAALDKEFARKLKDLAEHESIDDELPTRRSKKRE